METQKQLIKLETKESVARIEALCRNIQTSFVELGYHFKKIRENKGYAELGYASMEELAEQRFNLKSTSVKYMISVFEKFGTLENGVPRLAEDYRDYNYAQLTELVPVVNSVPQARQDEKKKEILETFPASLSAKQIRAIRKPKPVSEEKKKESKPTEKKGSGQSTDRKKNQISDAFQDAIKSYLDTFANENPYFAEKYANDQKTVTECCIYICSEVRKMNVNALTDDEVYYLARHYYEEIDITVDAALSSVSVVVSHV